MSSFALLSTVVLCAGCVSALSPFASPFAKPISRTRRRPLSLQPGYDGDDPTADLIYIPDHEFTSDDDTDCDVTGYGLEPEAAKNVFLISDSTGVTAKSALQKSLVQFDSCGDERFSYTLNQSQGPEICDVQTRTFTFIRSEAALASIVKKAKERTALVIFTIADTTLREKTMRMCELSSVEAVDLLGPTLDGLSELLDKAPLGVPGKRPSRDKVTLSDSYFRRIEAVEFTLKADDGQSPWLLKDADVIVVGVSRTGKTPLSVVLSQTMGLKVANIPLVLECPPPQELFAPEIDPDRVYCLTIAPSELKRIRTTRLERRNVKKMEDKYSLLEGSAKSNYADRAYLMKDLKNARNLAMTNEWTEIDVTGRAVEETASVISELMNERFDDTLYVC